MLKSRRGCLNRALGLGNPGLRNLSHDLVRRTWIDRRHPLAGGDLFAVDDERIFFPKLTPRGLERASHLLLILRMDKINKGRVFVAITRRSLAISTITRLT